VTADARPQIAVVVSARDASATIGRAVAAMTAQVGAPPYEVIVVDNASQDDTGALAAAAGARVLRLDDRAGGPGAARNTAVASTEAEFIAFTDADCFPVPGWLAALAPHLPDAELVAGPVDPDPEALARTHWDRTVAFDRESPLYPTANLAVRRSAFLAAGGFRDWVLDRDGRAPGHPYGEDTVLAWNVLRDGGRATFAPDALVHHAVFPETPRRWIERHNEMRHLPSLVRQVPELRRTLLLGGVFASERTLAATGAMAAVAAATATRRAAPLALAAPFAYVTARRTRSMGLRAAAIWGIADLVSSASLVAGSARARSVVL
jgi:glycosyltransferase involved in cell wall biosynthesis